MSISGPTPEQPTYRTDFEQSVNLFEKSFQGLQSSSLDAQKSQYVKVMQEALSTMQESANAMLNQHLLSMKDNLSQDLNTYLSSPTDAHRNKVQEDINDIKREER